MTPILGAAGRTALAGFLRPDTLLAFDYDGTLAPIVADPALARMRQTTQALLQAVARHRPTLILSGRMRSDALRLLGDMPVLEVIGNHGAEAGGLAAAALPLVRRWRLRLAKQLKNSAGVRIEDKHHSLSIHYRACADPAAAGRQIRALCAALPGARVVGGKSVVNLLPHDAPDKGSALLQALDRLGFPRALFVGDDETDEDVFRLRQPQRLLGVRVGRDEHSAAEYFLDSQDEIDLLLTLLGDTPVDGVEQDIAS